MAWTEERVTLLKKLWAEGLSASQIANKLGGVTRNAVIGKVHRLGLSGRATTSRIKSVRPRKSARAPTRTVKPKFINSAQASLKKEMESSGEVHIARPVQELYIPHEERASIATLRENSCRWPIGDPTEADFHFCGREKINGVPYCEFHARLAFQPVQARRKDRRIKQVAVG